MTLPLLLIGGELERSREAGRGFGRPADAAAELSPCGVQQMVPIEIAA